MKQLVHKGNLGIKIIAPEIKLDSLGRYNVYAKDNDFFAAYNPNYWSLEDVKHIIPWNEEDDDMVEAIIDALPGSVTANDHKEMVKWLNSLKERLTPKSEKELKKEIVLDDISNLCKKVNNCTTGLVTARLNHNTAKAVELSSSLEMLISNCQQELSYLHDYIKDELEPKKG